jgi:hypothetical protein
VPRGFGFVHHSRTIFGRAVPNPNITIRNFSTAAPQVYFGALGHEGGAVVAFLSAQASPRLSFVMLIETIT